MYGGDWGTRLHFLLHKQEKIDVLPPSSRRQAIVHRTIAFNFRVPAFLGEKEKTTLWVVFLFLVETGGLEPSTSCV